jgi:hypothetical protein
VIAPDDAGYDEARQAFLPLGDRRPAVIVRPVDAGEVARIVTLARETGLELAGWRRSSGATPRPTCSASTRTFRRRGSRGTTIQACGNRAKTRSYRQRRKGART